MSEFCNRRPATICVRCLQPLRCEDFPEIVCLCGSTRFMDAFHSVGWRLTLDGYIVLSVGVCKHAEHHGAEALDQDVVEKLDELHKRKIDLADWVMVLNVGGYIGDSTRSEIEYAKAQSKMVVYLEEIAGEKIITEKSDEAESDE